VRQDDAQGAVAPRQGAVRPLGGAAVRITGGLLGDWQRRNREATIPHAITQLHKAHRAGLAAVRPRRRFTDFHHAAMEVIARGLDDWGLLPVSVDEALSPRASSTAATWSAASATSWAWTCTTAPGPGARPTRARG
jgi:hypothetical protein